MIRSWLWKQGVAVAFVALLGPGVAAREKAPAPTGDPDETLAAAAAALLDGRTAEARHLLDTLPADVRQEPPESARTSSGSAVERRVLQDSLARSAVEPSASDPFDLLIDILTASEHSWDDSDPLRTLPWVRLFARQAARHGYTPMALYALRRFSDTLAWRVKSSSESRENRAEAAAWKPIVDHDLAALENPGSGGRAVSGPGPGMASAGTQADPIADRIRTLLARPRLDLFPESKLPAGMAASAADGPVRAEEESAEEAGADQDEDEEEPNGGPRPDGLTPPPHFAAVRVERQGEDAAAIGLSQDYDPVGEISRGAYWVLRSHDGGAKWGKPLYTGLRIEAPYVVHPTSNLPLLAPDRLEVEVSVRELDEASITFPPVALRSKREQHGLRLTIGLDALERDSDGDGLTDLAEERLVTDPASPDTDGDGLGDAVDSLPQVPWSQVMDDESAALAAVLENIAGMKSMAIIHEVRPPGDGADDLMARMKRASLSDERTTFVVGDRGPFRSLVLSRRAVVLTPGEIDAARRKFGPLMPLTLSLFVVDHGHQNGYVIWTASWVGGTLALEKSGSTWRVKVVSSWIT